jgi:hypothetical protein
MLWLSPPPNTAAWSDAQLRDAHVELQKHAAWLRRGIPLIVLAIIAVYVLAIKATVNAMPGEAVAAAFEKRATALAPRIERSIQGVGDRVTPVLAKDLAKQADAILPKFGNRIEEEGEALKKSLPDKMESIVLQELKQAGRYHAQLLRESFPELKDDPKKIERFVDALEMGFQKWAGDLLAQTFHKHIVEFGRIKETLNAFVAAEAQATVQAQQNAQKDGKVVADTRVQPEQLLSLWLEVFEQAVQGDGDTDLLAPPTQPAAAAAKTAK